MNHKKRMKSTLGVWTKQYLIDYFVTQTNTINSQDIHFYLDKIIMLPTVESHYIEAQGTVMNTSIF